MTTIKSSATRTCEHSAISPPRLDFERVNSVGPRRSLLDRLWDTRRIAFGTGGGHSHWLSQRRWDPFACWSRSARAAWVSYISRATLRLYTVAPKTVRIAPRWLESFRRDVDDVYTDSSSGVSCGSAITESTKGARGMQCTFSRRKVESAGLDWCSSSRERRITRVFEWSPARRSRSRSRRRGPQRLHCRRPACSCEPLPTAQVGPPLQYRHTSQQSSTEPFLATALVAHKWTAPNIPYVEIDPTKCRLDLIDLPAKHLERVGARWHRRGLACPNPLSFPMLKYP